MSTPVSEAPAKTPRRIRPARKLTGVVIVPGDKSISHRALMLAAAAKGNSRIHNIATGADVQSTRNVLTTLGAKFSDEGEIVNVEGVGRKGFKPTGESLDCGNSGTTIRLLAGLLAGSSGTFTLTGDTSLSKRPMKRIADPLRAMRIGVELAEGDVPPLTIQGGRVKPIDYELPLASAQVKSAIILAALSADGTTVIQEPSVSRDHTEIMLKYLGVSIDVGSVIEEITEDDPRRRNPRRTDARTITVLGPMEWEGTDFFIPGDFSTAAYFIAAGLLVKKSDVRLSSIGANPTRTGLMTVLATMGAKLNWDKRRTVNGEPTGTLHVTHSGLTARKISGKLIPRLIDELPLIAVLATQADGTTVIRDAAELRHKESDRIELVADNLRRMGAKIGALEDGWAIDGPTPLTGAEVTTGGDHRIAMAFTIAGLIADGETELDDADCAAVSCPEFFNLVDALR